MSPEMMLLFSILIFEKHYIADFVWQTPYMFMGKGKGGADWILPLFYHSAVHALLSLIILMFFGGWHIAWLAAAEFVAHAIIDRIKATYKAGPDGPWDMSVKGRYITKHYRAFAMDQKAHYICYALMAYVVAKGGV